MKCNAHPEYFVKVKREKDRGIQSKLIIQLIGEILMIQYLIDKIEDEYDTTFNVICEPQGLDKSVQYLAN